jgi:MATE family multidrug resistance protein
MESAVSTNRPQLFLFWSSDMTVSTEPAANRTETPVGGGVREVFTLAFPVVLTQLSATMMGIVDSAMVGRLGPTQLAAVGFASIWLWTLFSLIYGTASGVQTFVSQADGADEPQECGPWAWHGFYAVAPAVLVLVLMLWPAVRPLLALLGPSPDLQVSAVAYTTARLPGEVAFAVTMVLTSFFRGLGDTRTPLYVTLFANVVNAVLDYGLIFGELGLPAWGVRGAGTATAVGSWVGAIMLFALFRRRSLAVRYNTHPIAPNRTATARFLRTGAPIGGQWCIGMTAFACFTTVVARMGDDSMAASQAFVMLLSLSFMQAVGISVAASTLVGRYVGARDPDAANRTFHSAIGVGLALSGVIAVLFVAIPGPLLRIFTDDASVLALGRPLLVIGALFQVFDFVAIVSEGALRGAGDTRWPFVVETALGWGFFVPLAYIVGVGFEGGLTGAWVAGLVYVAALAWVLVRRFRSGAWRRIAI